MSGRLGVGRHTAAVVERGGRRKVADLSSALGDVEWSRLLCDRAEATVHVASSARSRMRDVFPWSHELHLWRDGDPVWCGPIKRIVNGAGYTIVAKDVTEWLTRRRTPFQSGPMYQKQFLATDLTDIALGLIESGYDLTQSRYGDQEDAATLDVLPHMVSSPTGVDIDYYVEPDSPSAPYIYDHLTALAEMGLRWTVLGRRIILGGPIAPDLPTLTDDAFAAQVEETVDGDQMGNWLNGVGGPTGGISAISTRTSGYFGTLDSVVDMTNVVGGAPEAFAWSDRWFIAHAHYPPSSLNIESGVPLSPSVAVPMGRLIPGAMARVNLVKPATPIDRRYMLGGVTVAESGGVETVTPVFLPEDLI